MSEMQGNTLEISLDFQFGPIPAIFSAHAPVYESLRARQPQTMQHKQHRTPTRSVGLKLTGCREYISLVHKPMARQIKTNNWKCTQNIYHKCWITAV